MKHHLARHAVIVVAQVEVLPAVKCSRDRNISTNCCNVRTNIPRQSEGTVASALSGGCRGGAPNGMRRDSP